MKQLETQSKLTLFGGNEKRAERILRGAAADTYHRIIIITAHFCEMGLLKTTIFIEKLILGLIC